MRRSPQISPHGSTNKPGPSIVVNVLAVPSRESHRNTTEPRFKPRASCDCLKEARAGISVASSLLLFFKKTTPLPRPYTGFLFLCIPYFSSAFLSLFLALSILQSTLFILISLDPRSGPLSVSLHHRHHVRATVSHPLNSRPSHSSPNSASSHSPSVANILPRARCIH